MLAPRQSLASAGRRSTRLASLLGRRCRGYARASSAAGAGRGESRLPAGPAFHCGRNVSAGCGSDQPEVVLRHPASTCSSSGAQSPRRAFVCAASSFASASYPRLRRVCSGSPAVLAAQTGTCASEGPCLGLAPLPPLRPRDSLFLRGRHSSRLQRSGFSRA